jgi:hypothetical protein
MFNENPSVVITQSRHTVTRPGNVKSYKICKLFYDLSIVVISQEFTWPKDKHKSQAPLQNKYTHKIHAMPEG